MADSFDWSNLFGDGMNAALMYWMQQQNSKKPNFYNVPLTPEQKYWDDAKKKLYEQGGSPDMQKLRSAGLQFIGSMPSGPTTHSFMSPEMKGQTFAGGIKPPKIDFSMFNNTSGTTPEIKKPPQTIGQNPPSTPANLTAGGDVMGPGRFDERPDTDFAGMGGGKPNTLAGLTEQFPTNGGMDGGSLSTIAKAWEDYKRQHPNWAKLGVSAAVTALAALTGLAGAVVGKGLQQILLRTDPTQQHSKDGKVVDASKAPLLGSGNGQWPSTSPGVNGETERTPYDVPFADQRAAQINSQFLQNLSAPGGGVPTGMEGFTFYQGNASGAGKR